MLSIIRAPSEVLRQPALPVTASTVKLAKVISEMKATLVSQTDPEGVGLAANQVGLSWRLFVARFETKKNSPIFAFINPEIVEHSDNLQPEEGDKKAPLEGCLSLPNYYAPVKRWQSIKIKYLEAEDEDFKNLKLKTENFVGFPATVIQHEMDHLNGKIFVERILEQNGKLYKFTGKNKKNRDNWEEVEL